jgi:MATE family multidrug resistance protein
METFCGQAAGARRHRVLGVVLQRGIAASAAVAIPCILVWTQAARILSAIGDPQQQLWCSQSLASLDKSNHISS